MERDRSITPRPPNGEMPSAARTIDLYGRAPDGGPPIIWKRAMSVVPGGDFERDGRWIKSGHYVIDYMGDAIVVHCGNQNDDNIIVQFVFDERNPYSAPRAEVEAMLLGKVMVSEEQQAAVLERKRLSDFFTASERLYFSRVRGRVVGRKRGAQD